LRRDQTTSPSGRTCSAAPGRAAGSAPRRSNLCLVARGWMDGYWEKHLQPWDVAAGALIVTEAGGIVTDWTGGRLDIHEGAVVATKRCYS